MEIMANAILNFARVLRRCWLSIQKDQCRLLAKDQKRYNREILYHYPIIPYGIRRVM